MECDMDYDDYSGNEEVETIPPSEWERRDHGEVVPGIDDVIIADRKRFAAFCKKVGWKMPKNFTKNLSKKKL